MINGMISTSPVVHRIFIILAISCIQHIAVAQNIYSLKSSTVSIFAGTPVEDIEAINSKSVSFLNIATGEFQISIPITGFKFKRALMEEHFNENYLESEKYPKAEFKGRIVDVANYTLLTAGTYDVLVEANLTIHGVTKNRKIEVKISNLGDNKLDATSSFDVKLEDYKIERPQIVWEKLAENVAIKINYHYELFKK